MHLYSLSYYFEHYYFHIKFTSLTRLYNERMGLYFTVIYRQHDSQPKRQQLISRKLIIKKTYLVLLFDEKNNKHGYRTVIPPISNQEKEPSHIILA